MKLLEIVVHDRNDAAIVDRASALGERMGKQPIRVRDVPGFASQVVPRGTGADGFMTSGGPFDARGPTAAEDTAGSLSGPFRILMVDRMSPTYCVSASAVENRISHSIPRDLANPVIRYRFAVTGTTSTPPHDTVIAPSSRAAGSSKPRSRSNGVGVSVDRFQTTSTSTVSVAASISPRSVCIRSRSV